MEFDFVSCLIWVFLWDITQGGCEGECRLSWTGRYPFVDVPRLEFGEGFENQLGVAQVGQEFVGVVFEDLFV